ncbi:nicotinate-nucleotide pyrophosphorylase (carboxylating) [Catalinimonas alkaloidigena]|uniref:Probable nicotinate-nucleotide pyrophosphorylase [carboxylating] n=1 Tax=Catalinimonas alkaloidigena TaxID=1075417 RepID=A0A1G9M2A9_9BACT|nr:carboxylating nicotinate-nucleotide diphosphorylase [Catalinimonas alkaloidigena]SDL67835.1 nicotinate-nucleotide pyrophosphorylase (carboxylating) [Catalinimonas alkaloidigena]
MNTTNPSLLPPYLTEAALRLFIQQALVEDVGDGDHSSLAAVPAEARQQARLLVKDAGVLAGVQLAERIFRHVDPDLELTVFLPDGAEVKAGDVALVVSGSARSILKAERLVLNCMQRMSGIATYTHQMAKLIEGTSARLLDTRKTTPGFRMLEKWAVLIGGGENHRFGLFDGIILKDNHVDYAGGVRAALEATQAYRDRHGLSIPVEIEVRNEAELTEALAVGGMDRIMLDNMTPAQMRSAVAQIGDRYETEASGGITEETIRAVAETGVDFISVGALTHSFRSLDLSLKAF